MAFRLHEHPELVDKALIVELRGGVVLEDALSVPKFLTESVGIRVLVITIFHEIYVHVVLVLQKVFDAIGRFVFLDVAIEGIGGLWGYLGPFVFVDEGVAVAYFFRFPAFLFGIFGGGLFEIVDDLFYYVNVFWINMIHVVRLFHIIGFDQHSFVFRMCGIVDVLTVSITVIQAMGVCKRITFHATNKLIVKSMST